MDLEIEAFFVKYPGHTYIDKITLAFYRKHQHIVYVYLEGRACQQAVAFCPVRY